jgi:hypothetical protein
MQALQLLFGFPQRAGVLHVLAVRVGRETFQPHIHPHLFAGGLVVNLALCLDGTLHIVPISPLYQPDPLDLGKAGTWQGGALSCALGSRRSS